MNTTLQVRRPIIDDVLLTSSSNKILVEEFLSWKESYTVAAKRAYRIWVERFQNFVNKPPEQFRHADYVAFANTLRPNHCERGVQFALTIVHNYLRFFAEQGRLAFPLYLARVPRALAKPREAITEDEYEKVLTHLRDQTAPQLRNLSIIMLLHDTGMRIGELTSLKIGDIDVDQSAVVRTEKAFRERRVYWNANTDNVIQRYLVERVNKGPVESDALFVAENVRSANAITTRGIQRMLKKVFKDVGLVRNLTAHSFRHSFVHRLAKLSVPDAIIAQLIGHSTPATIAHYTKLSRPELREFAERQLAFIGIRK